MSDKGNTMKGDKVIYLITWELELCEQDGTVNREGHLQLRYRDVPHMPGESEPEREAIAQGAILVEAIARRFCEDATVGRYVRVKQPKGKGYVLPPDHPENHSA